MIVAIGSSARVGKDTAGQALVRDLGFTKFAFADALKALALEADPLIIPSPSPVNTPNHSHLSWLVKGQGWETVKDRYPLARRFLENLGDGARTVFGLDFWVDVVMAGALNCERAVITDLRKRNEAERIRDEGGVTIRIDRPGYRARDFEHELDDWEFDLVVHNDASIPELEQQVVGFVREKLRRES